MAKGDTPADTQVVTVMPASSMGIIPGPSAPAGAEALALARAQAPAPAPTLALALALSLMLRIKKGQNKRVNKSIYITSFWYLRDGYFWMWCLSSKVWAVVCNFLE